jgi:hypothetical protein
MIDLPISVVHKKTFGVYLIAEGNSFLIHEDTYLPDCEHWIKENYADTAVPTEDKLKIVDRAGRVTNHWLSGSLVAHKPAIQWYKMAYVMYSHM